MLVVGENMSRGPGVANGAFHTSSNVSSSARPIELLMFFVTLLTTSIISSLDLLPSLAAGFLALPRLGGDLPAGADGFSGRRGDMNEPKRSPVAGVSPPKRGVATALAGLRGVAAGVSLNRGVGGASLNRGVRGTSNVGVGGTSI